MKKIFTLLALVLLSCMGAWAENITAVSQFVQGQVISLYNPSLQKYVICNNNQLLKDDQLTDASKLILVGDNTNGFLLYSPTTQQFVKDMVNDDNNTPLTVNPYEAGIYTFEACATGPDNSFSIKNLTYTGSHQYMHVNRSCSGVIPWNAGSSSNQASCWQIVDEGTTEVPTLDFSAYTVYDGNVNNNVVGYAKKGSEHPIAKFVAEKNAANYIKMHIFVAEHNRNNNFEYTTLNNLSVNKPVEGSAYKIRVSFKDGAPSLYLVLNSDNTLEAVSSFPSDSKRGYWYVEANGKLRNLGNTSYLMAYNSSTPTLLANTTGTSLNFPAGVAYGTLGICANTVASAVQKNGTISGGKFSNSLYDVHNNVWSCDYVFEEYELDLPKDGHAYYFVNVNGGTGTMNGTQRYIKYDESNANLTTEVYTEGTTEIPESSIFICKDRGEGATGGRFVFVNNKGHYLRYYGQSNGNSRKGALSENFSEADATVNIVKILKTGSFMSGVNSQAALYGLYAITGKRADKDHYNAGIVVSSSGDFSGVDTPHFVYNGYSTAFRIVEVENPNKVVLSKPESTKEGGLNGKFVGTFSAPYNVELPAGVKAYKAEINDAKTVVTFNEIDGNVVPKNIGVLVYAEAGAAPINENAVPAATATLPSVGTDNIFMPMVSGSIEAGNLVLGFTAGEGVMFYPLASAKTVANKAYIPAFIVAGSNLNAFRFDFEGDVTGIEAIESNASTTVFDLQGRRVQGAKSGLYIVNGKKVIR